MKFRQNPQKLFILAKTVTFMSCSVFVTRSMMLLLYFKILIISQLLSKTTKSSYRLQGHEGRSVQFELSLVSANFYASCKLHRPVFMTLEPIRWLCSLLRSWEMMSILKYNNNIINLVTNTLHDMKVTVLAKINDFCGFWRNFNLFMRKLLPINYPQFLCSNLLKGTFKNLS